MRDTRTQWRRALEKVEGSARVKLRFSDGQLQISNKDFERLKFQLRFEVFKSGDFATL